MTANPLRKTPRPMAPHAARTKMRWAVTGALGLAVLLAGCRDGAQVTVNGGVYTGPNGSDWAAFGYLESIDADTGALEVHVVRTGQNVPASVGPDSIEEHKVDVTLTLNAPGGHIHCATFGVEAGERHATDAVKGESVLIYGTGSPVVGSIVEVQTYSACSTGTGGSSGDDDGGSSALQFPSSWGM